MSGFFKIEVVFKSKRKGKRFGKSRHDGNLGHWIEKKFVKSNAILVLIWTDMRLSPVGRKVVLEIGWLDGTSGTIGKEKTKKIERNF